MDASRATVNDLVQACAHSADCAEWEELLRRSEPLVALVVMRVSRLWLSAASPALIDDIVQEVFLKLCEQDRRILRAFKPRGSDSFMGLLRMVAASVANDHFRSLYSVKRGGKVVTSSLQEETLSHSAEHPVEPRKMQQDVLLAQLDKCMRETPDAVSERDRVIFWLYYRQGFTAEEIARMGARELTSKGVESALRRATLWVRREIERRRPGEKLDP
jgi:RNA polymerase sigma-70 factor (ECF subfamily)